jgi:hypothetical protein
MKYILLFSLICLSPLLLGDSGKSNKKLDIYLCMGTKKEYRQCKISGLSKCQKKNKTRYNQVLNCPKLLKGLKIDEWNKKYKDRKFEWSKTCVSVKKEYKYCKKEGISTCIKSMDKRYEYLWCEMVLEERVDS